MGYAPELYDMVSGSDLADDEDDQLFYTKLYIDKKERERLGMQLDHRSELFQNLNGALSDIEVRFKGKESYVQNTVYNTVPVVIHANGPSKLFLNTLGNYIPKGWNPEDGCLNCWEDMTELDAAKVSPSLSS